MRKLILLWMIACGLSASAQQVTRVMGEDGSPQVYRIESSPNGPVSKNESQAYQRQLVEMRQVRNDRSLDTRRIPSASLRASASQDEYQFTDRMNSIMRQESNIFIPSIYADTEVEALKQIAKSNPSSTDLQEFIRTEGWKEDREPYGEIRYPVGVQWDLQTPSHITTLFIDNQQDNLVNLDVSAFKHLTRLFLQNATGLKKLDLSALSNLQDINYSGTNLLYTDVTFPDNFDLQKIYNTTYFRNVGTPLDSWMETAGSGTEIDLSSQAEIDGNKTIYTWYKEVNPGSDGASEEVNMPEGSSYGKFVFTGNVGDVFICKMTNPKYPNWRLQTPIIKVSRGNVNYNADDIAGLKKIASDNPGNKTLQEFISSKGWEFENWGTYQDRVRTNWQVDENKNARLTHLLFDLWYEDKDTLNVLDISKFAELRYLQSIQFTNISTLDVSNNPKLETLRIYSDNLAALNVSACPDLKELTFLDEYHMYGINNTHRNVLSSLDFRGCDQLKILKIGRALITNLDISVLTQLIHLHIDYCPDLQKVTGLEKALLKTVNVPNTTQFATYVKNLPASVIKLDCTGTDYDLPSDARLANLDELGIPAPTSSLDLANMPSLWRLNAWHSVLLYSGVKNYREISFTGATRILLPGSKKVESEYWNCIEPGDTIDFSSEASINGVKSNFIWINNQYNIEETQLFREVSGKPGVFVVDKDAPINEYGDYRCKLWNPLFSSNVTINSWGGWVIEVEPFRVLGEPAVPEKVLHEGDVQTLARIVSQSSSKLLTAWWNSGDWKNNSWQRFENGVGLGIDWSDEKVSRILSLSLDNLGDSLSGLVNVSGLDSLRSLTLPGNAITDVKLPEFKGCLSMLNLLNNPLASLIVSPYTELISLNIEGTNLKECDLSNNLKLAYLFCSRTDIQPPHAIVYPEMVSYGAPRNVSSFDMSKMPKLKELYFSDKTMKFSDVQNAHPLEYCYNFSTLFVTDSVWGGVNQISYSTVLDFSKENKVNEVGSEFTWVKFSNSTHLDTLSVPVNAYGKYQVTPEMLKPGEFLSVTIRNSIFPDWRLNMLANIYTCDGDANIDSDVNIQDVTATVSEIIRDLENHVAPFGYYQADVNRDEKINVADVIGIVNLIQSRPIAKFNELRNAFEPVVRLSTDEKGGLYIDAPVAIAGIQLTLTGVKGEMPLLGNAARFSHAFTVGDSLRLIAYSLNGQAIPAGKSLLAQLPKDAQLVEAVFSDANARALRSDLSGVVTSGEEIDLEVSQKTIVNYPNPFRGTTTFSYTIANNAEQAMIQIYSASGALVKTLAGLPSAMGRNEYTASIHLPAGVYYYRLAVVGEGKTNISKSNIFIIK